MSLTPMTPNFNTGVQRSWWSRPEGKFGKVILAALGIGAAFSVYVYILPILMWAMVSTINLCLMGLGLFVFFMLVTNKKLHYLVGLWFRLIITFLARATMQIDPIGILKDRLQEMRKRRDGMAEQVTNVKGSISQLQAIMQKNAGDSQSKLAMAMEAKRRIAIATSPEEADRMKTQAELNARQAQRLQRSNLSYQQLLTKLQTIYSMLSKWLSHIDFYIDDTTDEVRQQEVQFKTINSAWGAYKKAMAVISGNADENEMYNDTMQFLADDAAQKLGEIDDFQRVAQNFMDTIDLQNASVNNEALKTLEDYEQKVLTPGSASSAFLLPDKNDRSKAPVDSKALTNSRYNEFFS